MTIRLDKGKPCGEGFISANKECRIGKTAVKAPSRTKPIAKAAPVSPVSKTSTRNTPDKSKPSKPFAQKSKRVADSARTLQVSLAGLTIAAAAVGLATIAYRESKKSEPKVPEIDPNFAENFQARYKQRQAAYEEFHRAYQQERDNFNKSYEDWEAEAKKEWHSRTGQDWDAFKDRWKRATGQEWDDFRRTAEREGKRQQWGQTGTGAGRNAGQSNSNQNSSRNYNNQQSRQRTQAPPEEEAAKNWWDVLGVNQNATADEIKKAYRKKAKEFHPDVNKDPNASEMMKEINDAFDRSGKRRDSLRLDAPTDIMRQIAIALKRTIETVFRGGIDAILTFSMSEDDTITGKFRDENQVYDFKITPTNELSYVESKVRSDAYLLGYYIDSGNSRGVRQDRKPVKKKVCLRGKPCGDTCIAKGDTCKVKLSLRSSEDMKAIRDELRALRKEVRELKDIQKSGASGSATGSVTPEKTNEVAKKFDVSKAVAGASIAGAALVGMPIAGYMAFRLKYHVGFKQSANEAKKIAGEMQEEIPNELKGGYKGINGGEANQITFVVGGFAGQGGQNSLQYAQQLAPNPGSPMYDEMKKNAENAGETADLFEDHHVVAINNKEFEIRPAGQREKLNIDIPFTGQALTDGNVEQFRVMLNSAIAQGKNPVAVETAAKAYAYHQKFPDKPINLLGYSAGGMVTHEAAQILKEMGVKNVRVANFGSPYWGLTDKVGDSITFASKNDPAISQGGVAVRDPVMVNSVVDHFSYLRDGDVRRKLKNLFSGKPAKSETPVWVPGVTTEPKEATRDFKFNPEAAKAAQERAQRLEELQRKQAERSRKNAERRARQGKQDAYTESFTYYLQRQPVEV